MKKNKGFTLIELLAIIVILAIIAVITVPIILNIIENSRKGAAVDSAYGYKDAISKYYVSEMIDNQNLKLDGTYSVDNGSLKKGEETPIEIPTSGDSPSVGWVKIEENEVTKACLTIGDYKVELKDGKFETNGKGECGTIPPVKFDDETSWAEIIEAVKDGNTDDMNVGDTKQVTLTGEGDLGGTYTLRIANISNSKTNGCMIEEDGEMKRKPNFSETACGFVLEFADIITKHRMNPYSNIVNAKGNGNIGGWEYSEMRTYVNNDIYNALPEELRNNIIPTTVVSGHGTNDSENFTTTDNLYLLSTKEVYGKEGTTNIIEDDTAEAETRQLDYYKEQGVTTNNYSGAIKKNGSSSSYWGLRSAISSKSNGFFGVGSAGVWYYSNSSDTYGVAPAFRIAEKITME